MDRIRQRILARAYNRKAWEMPKLPISRSPQSRTRRQKESMTASKSAEKSNPVGRKSDPINFAPESFASSSVIELPTEEPDTVRFKATFSVKTHPICLLMLESYIREVCNEIERTNYVCHETLKRAKTMIKALNDCTKAIPSLSIFFYNLARSILNELGNLNENSDFRPVLSKMIELTEFITEKRYISKESPVSKFQNFDLDIGQLKAGLLKRLGTINTKNLNILSKVIKIDPELKRLTRLYVILLKSFSDIAGISTISSMPAKVVEATKRIPRMIENKTITEDTIEMLRDELKLISMNKLKQKSKSLGIFIYELLSYSTKYFYKCSEVNYQPAPKRSPDIRSKKPLSKSPSERSFTPRKSRSSAQIFSDPQKQMLFESIIMQQDIANNFRKYLKQILDGNKIKEVDQETEKKFKKQKESIVEAFSKKFEVSESDKKKLIMKSAFLDHLKSASKLPVVSKSLRI